MPKGVSKLFTPSLLLDSFNLLEHKPSSGMKKASVFLKEAFTILVSMLKAKTMAVKSKTRAMKARLIVFGLLRDKKMLVSAISHKIHALKAPQKVDNKEEKAIVLYGERQQHMEGGEDMVMVEEELEEEEYDDDDDDHYPDLRHSLFDDDDEGDGGAGAAIDMVRNTKEQKGEEFKLEDEIDLVADIFIRRFHRKMMMEKMDSFKRSKEILENI